MKKKRLSLLLSCVFVLAVMAACHTDIAEDQIEETDDDDGIETVGDHEAANDYIWDSSSVTQIALKGSSITVTGSGATVSGSKVTITAAGNYSLSGSLTNGQVIVNTADKAVVRLILNGVNITCSSSAPIYITDSEKTIINLADNTENVLTDGTSYVTVDGEPNAAIFSKSDLTIFGSGKLTVVGNYMDGITSKDGLIIKSGTISVTSKDDGIRGKDYLIIKDGNITVKSGGDGLKSDNEVSTIKGYVSIAKGVFNIISGGDAISAYTEINIADGTYNLTSGGGSSKSKPVTSAKGIKALVGLTIDTGTFTISSADDALHSNGKIIINGGTINLSSSDDGIHANAAITINSGTIIISKSFEGIESHLITVNNGNVSVTSSDDGFNATAGLVNGGTEQDDKSFLYINGGYIMITASGGDPLDSNGSIVMTAGTVVVHGPASSPEVAIDYNGTFNLSGGFMVASGTNSNMTQAPGASSSQKSLLVMFRSSLTAETIFHIMDSSGIEVVTFKPVRKYQSMVFSSPLLVQGATFKIYTGGSSTGTFTDGLGKGGAYTPGTLYASFTVSSAVTRVN